MNKNDLRYKKSHELIRETFIHQLKTIGFSSITVKGLIEEAHINRSTFYAHYEDKYALLDDVENMLLDEIAHINDSASFNLAEPSETSQLPLIKAYLTVVTQFFRDNGALIQALLNESSSNFFIKLKRLLHERWRHINFLSFEDLPQSYAEAIFVGIIVNVLIEWVQSDFRETNEEFVRILMCMLAYFQHDAVR